MYILQNTRYFCIYYLAELNLQNNSKNKVLPPFYRSCFSEVKQLAQGHTAGKWQSWNLHLSSCAATPKPRILSHYHQCPVHSHPSMLLLMQCLCKPPSSNLLNLIYHVWPRAIAVFSKKPSLVLPEENFFSVFWVPM